MGAAIEWLNPDPSAASRLDHWLQGAEATADVDDTLACHDFAQLVRGLNHPDLAVGALISQTQPCYPETHC
jgi:hypothetical protein